MKIERESVEVGALARGQKPKQIVSEKILEGWREKHFERQSIENWLDEQNEHAPLDDRLASVVEVITPLFVFLAHGYRQSKKQSFGTIHMRAWVLLYCLRSDLIMGQTLIAAGEQLGCAHEDLVKLIREFEAMFPRYRRPHLLTKSGTVGDRQMDCALGRTAA